MNIRKLVGFVTIVDLGSINAAARKLSISQPALSKTIRLMEEHYGLPLLTRDRSGAVPTEFGRTLLEHARIIVAESEKAEQNLAEIQQRFEGGLSISVAPAPALELVPRALRSFCRQCPDVTVSIRESVFPRAGAQLSEGMVDLAVGPTSTVPQSGSLKTIHLLDYELAVMCSPSHPLARATSLAELTEAKWLQIGDAGAASSLITGTFRASGLTAPVAQAQCHSITSAVMLMQSVDLMSILPKEIRGPIVRAGQLIEVPVVERILENPCGIVVDNRRPQSRIASLMAVHLQRVASQMLRERP